MRVLLVDDEEEFVSTLAERFLIRGIAAEWATSSQEAIKLVESGSFDVAVLDVKMPKLGGFALKKKLQAIQPGMRFLFLTGYGSEEDFRDVSSQLGDGCYMVKPVDIDALIEKIKDVLREQEEKTC